MSDNLTIRGFVGAAPQTAQTKTGRDTIKLRVATNSRKRNSAGEWVTSEPNWYTVIAYDELALNIAATVEKGDPLLVTGRLRIRDWVSQDKTKAGTAVELVATTLGFDLALGTATFTRTPRTAEHGGNANESVTEDYPPYVAGEYAGGPVAWGEEL